MTITSERLRAINETRLFLYSLLNPKETPRVPKVMREKARRCLRHYPWAGHVMAMDRDGKELLPDKDGIILNGDVVLK